MKISNKIALIGDVHIGVNKNSEEYFDLTERWLKYFIDEIEQRKINHVFILGDWHHYRDEISVMALNRSSKMMSLFPKNITVHILTGNHDCYFKDTSEIHSLEMFKEWENIRVYDEISTIETTGGKHIKVIPWGGELSDKSQADYVFGHFEINNFKMNNFKICDNGDDSSSLLKMGKQIYTGHFHKYQTKKYKSGSITYVGSPIQHDFNDVDNVNGFHILDTSTGECDFVVNEGFPVYKYIKLSKLKDIKGDDLRGNYVKFIIDADIKEATLEKAVIKFNSFNPKSLIVDDTTMKKNLDIDGEDVNIDALNIEDSILEFIDKLGDLPNKQKIIEKIKYYYEKENE
jgi:DNA repair exonuclease SbcCD nuclease subunit